MPLAITTYAVVEALHVIAVLAAFGVPLAYPLLLPYVRRHHRRAMPAFHAVQRRLNDRLTAPGIVAVLLLGAYMASKQDLWDEVWVDVPIAILVAIGAIGGAIIGPAVKRMIELSGRDVAAAGAGDDVAWSADYDAVFRRYMTFEVLLGVLVLVAVFFMAARPFS